MEEIEKMKLTRSIVEIQNKIINYWFYPVHLLILGILRMYFKI